LYLFNTGFKDEAPSCCRVCILSLLVIVDERFLFFLFLLTRRTGFFILFLLTVDKSFVFVIVSDNERGQVWCCGNACPIVRCLLSAVSAMRGYCCCGSVVLEFGCRNCNGVGC